MTKVTVDHAIAEKIRGLEGPIELVDSDGRTVGMVRRPPTESEIERAGQRASRGGQTLTWAQVRAKFQMEISE
jgi:hypothetical protein